MSVVSRFISPPGFRAHTGGRMMLPGAFMCTLDHALFLAMLVRLLYLFKLCLCVCFIYALSIQAMLVRMLYLFCSCVFYARLLFWSIRGGISSCSVVLPVLNSRALLRSVVIQDPAAQCCGYSIIHIYDVLSRSCLRLLFMSLAVLSRVLSGSDLGSCACLRRLCVP